MRPRRCGYVRVCRLLRARRGVFRATRSADWPPGAWSRGTP